MNDDGQNKLDYFIDQTNDRLVRMEAKIDALWDHKNLLLGGALVISTIAGTLTALIIAFIERG